MTWKDRYDRMKKHYGDTDAEVARITGMSEKTVNVMIRREPFVRWLRYAIVKFEKEHNLNHNL